jgi:hypothetical protein
MSEYPYEKIVKIAERISKMKDKKYKNDLKQIKKIIENNNPEISMTKNNNGYFSPEFETLNDSTFIELTKFFEKIDHECKSTESNSDNSHLVLMSEKNEIINNTIAKKLKYTNSENHLLNKMKYEIALKQHKNECLEESEKKQDNLKIKQLSKIIERCDDQNVFAEESCEKIFKKQKKNAEKKITEKKL